MKQFDLKPCTLNVLRALSIMCVAAPIAAHAQTALDIGTVSASGNGSVQSAPVPEAAKIAVSQGSLDARSAESIVSDNFVRNFTSPVADFSQVFQITPGAYSYSPNGVGQGNASTDIRGLTDSQYLVTFDGIPFNDTNGVSHHSYVYFPAQTVGGAVVDRSPGSAATIGQATFGGSLNLLSRTLEAQESTSVTGSYGTWATSLVDLQQQTGNFGQDGAQRLWVDVQQMKSDGYQTYDNQDRKALSAKYQYIVSPDTVLTAFTSYMDVTNNQLDGGAATRANIAAFGDNYLSSNDPTQYNYYGYNFYAVKTSFSYADITSNLGGGWKIDDKLYNYGYHNQENYVKTAWTSAAAMPANTTVLSKQNDPADDKLNSYHTSGNLLRLSQDSATGTLRTGIWTEYANSDRHQFPSNPLNWIDTSAPFFSETYQTITVQPYVEYEFKVSNDLKITPGLKYANYKQDYIHLADIGKGVGALGGTVSKSPYDSIVCAAGATCLPSVSNSITYSDLLPSLDAHYLIQPNWTAYAQWAEGDLIPPTSVFDVPNAQTTTAPKSQKSQTFQVGTVWKSDRYTLDADIYHVKLDNSYTSYTDPTDPANTLWAASGTEITQGMEVEGTVILGGGFSIYANATVGNAKYSGGPFDGLWVPGAPGDTEGLGLIYNNAGWNSALFVKRVGKLYNVGAAENSYTIDPVTLANLFVNYTIKNPATFLKDAKFQLAVNNLFDSHSITGISGSGSDANPLPADNISLLPARSVALTVTLDF